VGNWLTPAQGTVLLERLDFATLRGKRSHAILAMLIGCGLRRGELLSLAMDSIQVREEHWVIADLKGGTYADGSQTPFKQFHRHQEPPTRQRPQIRPLFASPTQFCPTR
jgi:integrase